MFGTTAVQMSSSYAVDFDLHSEPLSKHQLHQQLQLHQQHQHQQLHQHQQHALIFDDQLIDPAAISGGVGSGTVGGGGGGGIGVVVPTSYNLGQPMFQAAFGNHMLDQHHHGPALHQQHQHQHQQSFQSVANFQQHHQQPQLLYNGGYGIMQQQQQQLPHHHQQLILHHQTPQQQQQQQQYTTTAHSCLTDSAVVTDGSESSPEQVIRPNAINPETPRRPTSRVPEDLKSDSYWKRRVRNNLSAKKSREKKRIDERRLQQLFAQLSEEVYANLLQYYALQRCRDILGGPDMRRRRALERPPYQEEMDRILYYEGICYGLRENFRNRGLPMRLLLPWRQSCEDLNAWTDRRFLAFVASDPATSSIVVSAAEEQTPPEQEQQRSAPTLR